MSSVVDTRYAHPEGASICFSPKGGKILTGGSDGEIRIFESIEDEDFAQFLVGDEVSAVSCGENCMYVAATGTNTVQSFSLDEGKCQGVLTRFTADVTTLDISTDKTLLASGSGDMTVKVTNVDSFKTVSMVGHDAPVLSVALDPKNEFVLSSSCDGTVRVWKSQSGEQIYCTKDVFPKSNDTTNSPVQGQVAWHPQGKQFAVPSGTKVKIFSRNSWTETSFGVEENSLNKSELLSGIIFSPSGTHLMASTNFGQFFVWNLEDYSKVCSIKSGREYGIADLKWHPKKESDVVFIDKQGFWGLIKIDFELGKQKESLKEPVKSSFSKIDEEEMDEDQLADALFGDDDDEEDSFSIRKIKKETGFLSDDDSNLSKPAQTPSESITSRPTTPLTDASKMPPPAPVISYEPDIQEPFQPGSTPIHLSSRFMKWNDVGIVQSIKSEGEKSIEVEFHDSSVHHSMHFSNVQKHYLADLSREAIVMASEANEDEMVPSKLVVNHFASSDMSKEWSFDMPNGEEILALCCGTGWVAAATDRRRLRIFTITGLQRDILSLPGPITALAGHNDQLFVTVTIGMPLPGDQNIHYVILRALGEKADTTSQFSPLPLAPKSFLSWMGFSDEGTPCIVDSAGQVRLLNAKFGAWMEVCDTKSHTKGKSDNHFVVGLSEQELKIRSILCKGSRYPLTIPKPTIILLPMSLPLCNSVSERSMLEEKYLMQSLQRRAIVSLPAELIMDDDETLEREQQETLIKLFAMACKVDHDSRALEVCKLMDLSTIQVAIKYAAKARKMQLANKLSELAMVVQEKEDQERENEQDQELTQDEDESTQGSNADLFGSASEDSNPILIAKQKKKDMNGASSLSLNDSMGEFRNPFKKSKGSPAISGSIRQGLVFDDMTLKSQGKAGSATKQFGANIGQRNKPGIVVLKKTNQQGKENSNDTTKQLKGYPLWLAENKIQVEAEFPDLDETEVNAKALDKWKNLGKEVKETYKSPRVPRISSKRKLVTEEGLDRKTPKMNF